VYEFNDRLRNAYAKKPAYFFSLITHVTFFAIALAMDGTVVNIKIVLSKFIADSDTSQYGGHFAV